MQTLEEIQNIIKKEGDYKEFEYQGNNCYIIRHSFTNGFFNLCGYVSIPKDSKYYGVDFNDLDIFGDFNINFSSEKLRDEDKNKGWFIGFDCCHSGDIFSIAPFISKNHFLLQEGDTYKNMDYVSSKLKKLVDYIISSEK